MVDLFLVAILAAVAAVDVVVAVSFVLQVGRGRQLPVAVVCDVPIVWFVVV